MQNPRDFLIVLTLTFVVLVTSARAQAPAAPAVEDSAVSTGNTTTLWVLEDADSKVYLLGSVHLLRPQDHPLPEAMQEAYEDSARVVCEISQQEMMTKGLPLIMEKGTYQGGGSIQDDLTPETYQKLQAALGEKGLPQQALDTMKPWLAAISYMSLAMQQEGFSSGSGVDAFFEGQARRDGKPVESLETVEFQIDLFASLAGDMEDEFLLKTLEETETMMESLDPMIAAWKKGEAEGIEKLLNDSFDDYPELRQSFLVDRNANWVPKIEEYLGGSTDTLVVVGAGHLVGEESVVEMLREEGHTVTQL